MGHPYGSRHLVHVLAARAAGMENIHPHVVHIQINVHLFRHGQYGDRRGRRVDAALRFCLRHPLNAMHTRLVLEPRVRRRALHAERNLLEAPAARLVGVHQVRRPPS